jgi:hypothetical protein
MALTVATDTYATLAEANAYATLRGWTDWAALSDPQKELRLTEAAVYLDQSYTWKGRVTLTTQPMSWPRYEVYDKEGRLLKSDLIPQRLKDAQIELARLASEGLVTNDTQGEVKSIQAGSVGITFKDAQNVSEAAKYRSIDRLLAGLYVSRSGRIRTVPLING